MKEARIECLCADYRLSDLLVGGKPLRLLRGDVVWVPASAARQSQALTHAERVGAVSVEWHERSRVAKSPTPPWLKRKRVVRSKQAAPSSPKPPPAAPQVDTEAIAQRAEAAAAKAASEAMSKGLEEIKELLKGQSLNTPTDELEAALRKLLPNMIRPAEGATPVDPDAPVFIPKDIVNKEAEGSIEIAAEASEGEGLDAAAEALKAAKKPTRKRKPAARKRKPATPKEK